LVDSPDPGIDVNIIATLTPPMLGVLRTHGFDLPSCEELMKA